MTTKETVLCAFADLQKALTLPEGTPPALILVYVPETREFIQMTSKLEGPEIRKFFAAAINDLFVEQEKAYNQVAAGAKRLFTVPLSRECLACGGSGTMDRPDLARRVICPNCNGVGRIPA